MPASLVLRRTLLASLTLLIGAGSAHAALRPGDIDPRFGVEPGYTPVTFGTGSTVGHDVVPVASGGWYTSGTTIEATVPATGRPLLARFDADGLPDLSFGTGGVVQGPQPSTSLFPYSVLLRDAQRLYQIVSDASRHYVIAYTLNGAIDPTYGNGGIATVESGLTAGNYSAMLQADGVVIAGTGKIAGSPTSFHFLLAKLTPDGELDAGFAGGGRAFYALHEGAGARNILTGITVDPSNGTLLVAGRANAPGQPQHMVAARFTATGLLDPAFGTAGYASIDVLPGSDLGRHIRVRADGRMVITGTVCEQATENGISYCRIGAARLLANGTLDGTFGDQGVVVHSVETQDPGDSGASVLAMHQDKLGRIVVGGQNPEPEGGTEGFLLRMRADGQLDPTFGQGGVVRVETGSIIEIMPTEIPPFGGVASKRLVTAGSASVPQPEGPPRGAMAIARYLDMF